MLGRSVPAMVIEGSGKAPQNAKGPWQLYRRRPVEDPSQGCSGNRGLRRRKLVVGNGARQSALVAVALIRHAQVSNWACESADRIRRRLSPQGRRQAEGLVKLLGPWSPQHVLSSPYTRCVETVAPLVGSLGLNTEVSVSLAEGAGVEAVALVRSMGGRVALCTHGDVISEVLISLADEDHLELGPAPRQANGSAWILERCGERFVKATYIPPAG